MLEAQHSPSFDSYSQAEAEESKTQADPRQDLNRQLKEFKSAGDWAAILQSRQQAPNGIEKDVEYNVLLC